MRRYEATGCGYEVTGGYEARGHGYEPKGAGYEVRSSGYEPRCSGYEAAENRYEASGKGYEVSGDRYGPVALGSGFLHACARSDWHLDTSTPHSFTKTPGGTIPVVLDLQLHSDQKSCLHALALLAGDPRISLKAVTLTPGTAYQVSSVHRILEACHAEGVRVGAKDWPLYRDAKSSPPRSNCSNCPATLDDISNLEADVEGSECAAEDAASLLVEICDKETVILTGTTLHNLCAGIQRGLRCKQWVGQAGYAVSDSVLPISCPSSLNQATRGDSIWSHGGHVDSVLQVLTASLDTIPTRFLVSPKRYDLGCNWRSLWQQHLDLALQEARRTRASKARISSLELLLSMPAPDEHCIHDLLALSVVLDSSFSTYTEEVELFLHGAIASNPLAGASSLQTSQAVHGTPIAHMVENITPIEGIPMQGLVGGSKGQDHKDGKTPNFVQPARSGNTSLQHPGAALGVPVKGDLPQWGARLQNGSGMCICTIQDASRCLRVLLPFGQ